MQLINASRAKLLSDEYVKSLKEDQFAKEDKSEKGR